MGYLASQLKRTVPLYEYVYGQGVQLFKCGREYSILCPFHAEKTPSCHVNEIRFHCFGCGKHGDIYDYIRLTQDCSYTEAVDLLKEFPRTDVSCQPAPTETRGLPSFVRAPGPYEAAVSFGLSLGAAIRLVALHTYTYPSGKPLFYVVRWEDAGSGKKVIRPMHEREPGTWVATRPRFTTGTPLYNLHTWANKPGLTYVVEGEKAADALAAQGVRATTSGGATTARCADWRPLKREECVYFWPDNDKPGYTYALEVAKLLGLDALNLILPTDAQPGDDAYDHIQRHGNIRNIRPLRLTTDSFRAICEGKQ